MSVLALPRREKSATSSAPLDHARRLSATRAAMASALVQHFRTRIRRTMTPADIRQAVSVYVLELQGGDAPSEVIDVVAETLRAEFAAPNTPPAKVRGPEPSFAERIRAERTPGKLVRVR